MSLIHHPWVQQGSSVLYKMDRAYPTALTVNTGTLSAGVVADVATIGGNMVDVTEAVGTPGFDIVFDWTGVVGIPQSIRLVGYYAGGANHAPQCQLYDYVAAGWIAVEAFYDMSAVHTFSFPSNSRFVSAGAMSLRFYHAAGGVGTHHMYVDFLAAELWRE